MDTEKLLKTEKPIWKQSPSIRDIKKATASIKSKFKILKYTFPFILLSLVSDEIQAQIPQNQNFYYGQNKQAPLQQNNLPKQNIIFDEVGKQASNLKYIHVAIPLNITTFYEQGLILETYLKNLANTITSEIHRIPFTKAAQDTRVWGLRRLSKIMKQVVHLDQTLPHNDTIQKTLETDNAQKRLKRDIACLY
jgi:hypothetical protein